MAVKVKVIGLNILRKNLERNIVLHQSKVRKAVSKCGDRAVWESQLRAPKDEGMLEESIAKELGVTAEGQVARVMVPVNAPGAAYAIAMHEDQYQLGEKSQAKQASAGVEVGRKYLTRGVEAGKPIFEEIIKDNLKV